MRQLGGTACWAMILLTLAVGGATAAGGADDPILGTLPEKPLMLLRLGSLKEARDAFLQTHVGAYAQQEPLLASAAETGRDAVRFTATALTDLTESDLERLAGREAALVVLRPGGPPAMIVVDLGGDAGLIERAVRERLVPRFTATNPRLRASVEEAASGTLVRWQDGRPRTTCMRFVSRFLAVGPEAAVATLRPSGGGAIATFDAAPEGFASAYLDAQALWDPFLARMPEPNRRGFEGSGIPAVSELWSATAVADGAFRDTVVARLTPGAGGLLPALAALEPGPTQAARVVPVSHPALLACRIESGKKLFELVEGLVRSTQGEPGVERFRANLDNVDRMFAINMEWELLPAIGGEAFVAVRLLTPEEWAAGGPPRGGDLDPIWGFAVRDEQLLREMIDRFRNSPEAQQLAWQLISEDHGGVQIHTVRNMVSPAHFSLAIVGGYCVFTHEVGALRAALDAVAAGQTLAQDAAYQAACKALPADVNASLYVDTRPLRQGLLALLNRRAPQAKRPLLPLLDRALPDLGGYAAAAVAEDGLIRFEGRGELPALFAFFNFFSLGGTIEAHRWAASTQRAGARR